MTSSACRFNRCKSVALYDLQAAAAVGCAQEPLQKAKAERDEKIAAMEASFRRQMQKTDEVRRRKNH